MGTEKINHTLRTIFLTKVSGVFTVTAFGFVGCISLQESRQFSNIPDHRAPSSGCVHGTFRSFFVLQPVPASLWSRRGASPWHTPHTLAVHFWHLMTRHHSWGYAILVWIGLDCLDWIGGYNPSLAAIKTNHLRQLKTDPKKNHLQQCEFLKPSTRGSETIHQGNLDAGEDENRLMAAHLGRLGSG